MNDEDSERYYYWTTSGGVPEQRSAIRATAKVKAQERAEMEAKGFIYCERKVNEREVAYWFEKPFRYPASK